MAYKLSSILPRQKYGQMTEIAESDSTSPGKSYDDHDHFGQSGRLQIVENVDNFRSDHLKLSADQFVPLPTEESDSDQSEKQEVVFTSGTDFERSAADLELEKSGCFQQSLLKLQKAAGGSGPSLQTSEAWTGSRSDTHRPRALDQTQSYQGKSGVLLFSSPGHGPLGRYTRNRSASVDLGRVEDPRLIKGPSSWKINPDYWDDGWTCGPQYHVVGCSCKHNQSWELADSCFEKSLGKSTGFADRAAAAVVDRASNHGTKSFVSAKENKQISAVHSNLRTRRYSHDSIMAHRSHHNVKQQQHDDNTYNHTDLDFMHHITADQLDKNTSLTNRTECKSPPHTATGDTSRNRSRGYLLARELGWGLANDEEEELDDDTDEEKSEPPATKPAGDRMITTDSNTTAELEPEQKALTLSNNKSHARQVHNSVDVLHSSSQDGYNIEEEIQNEPSKYSDTGQPHKNTSQVAAVENSIPLGSHWDRNDNNNSGSFGSHGDRSPQQRGRKQVHVPGKGNSQVQELSHLSDKDTQDLHVQSCVKGESVVSPTEHSAQTYQDHNAKGILQRNNTSEQPQPALALQARARAQARLQRANTCPTLNLRKSIEKTRAKLQQGSEDRVVSHDEAESRESKSKLRSQSASPPLSGSLSVGKPFKPLAVSRLAKVSRKNLQSFEDLSPISSRSTSRRSSVSSTGALEPKDLHALEKEFSEAMRRSGNQPRSVSDVEYDLTSPSLYRKEFPYPGQSLKAVSEEGSLGDISESERTNDMADMNRASPTDSVYSETDCAKMSIRVDFSNLRVGRPTLEGLRSTETRTFTKRSSSETRLPITVDLSTPMSAPASPVRTLQDLTAKMRGRGFNYTEVQITPPMSPEPSEPGDDEGCVLSEPHEWPVSDITPRRSRKTGKFMPEVPEILLKNKEELEREASTKFTLKANLKPLNTKHRTAEVLIGGKQVTHQRLTGAGATYIELKSEKVDTPSSRRRKKYATSVQSSLDGSGSNGETNGRSRSDPTQERKRSVSDLEGSSIDNHLFGTLQGSKTSLSQSNNSNLGSSGVSTESTLSISSVATSISDTTADQMYINVYEDVTNEPGGVINNNLDEKNDKSLKKKSLTWPNGDKSPNELMEYAQGIQVANSEPTVSDRQEQLTEIQEVARYGAPGKVDPTPEEDNSQCLTVDNKQRTVTLETNASNKSPEVSRRKPPQKRNRGGSGEALEQELKSAEKLRRQGSLSEKQVPNKISPTGNKTPSPEPPAVPSKPFVRKHERSQSAGPTGHPPERKTAVRKKPIIPPPEKGHLLRPVLQQTQLSGSSPELNLQPPHRSQTTDALISPTRSKGPPGNQTCATLPRAAAKVKDSDLSPGSRRRKKQQVSYNCFVNFPNINSKFHQMMLNP